LSERGVPIVVEGMRDRECLRALGVRGEIVCTQSFGNGFGEFVSGLSGHREVIVLTDFDDEGEMLSTRLSQELARAQIRVNTSIWRQLHDLARSDIRSIEELGGLLEKLRVHVFGPRAVYSF
jgi:5S rRNA maturation endonuclease (ribonuclease M5)